MEDDEHVFETLYDIIKDYSDYAAIQGLNYIFFANQTLFGRIFWIIVVTMMLCLGVYWSITAYLDWQDQLVLTTITTTAYSVKQIEFPAVTFCSPGD